MLLCSVVNHGMENYIYVATYVCKHTYTICGYTIDKAHNHTGTHCPSVGTRLVSVCVIVNYGQYRPPGNLRNCCLCCYEYC